MDFKGKVALVTGSGRGIGRTIASRLAALGAQVIICDIDPDSIRTTAEALAGQALPIRADVTDVEQVEALFKQALEKFGRIDIVVNNAGVTRDGLLVRMDPADWDMVLDINLKGAFLVTKAAARQMMKQRYGRIVNISSVIGLTGNVGQANYAASKAGLIGLTKSAAKELAPRGVTVNAVAPGFIETDMTAVLPEATRQYLLSRAVINRAGTPDDVAQAVIFLASDEAGYITGQVLAVDGGMTM